MSRTPHLSVALLLLVLWTTITVGGGMLQAGGTTSIDAIVAAGPLYAIPVAAVFLLLIALPMGWRRSVGLTRPTVDRSLIVPLLVVGLLLGLSLRSGLPAGETTLALAGNSLAVGLSEELMFRGVLLAALLARFGVRRGVIISAVAFGAVHSLNAFITGEPLQAVSQSLLAIGMGFWAADLRLRGGSLLLPALLHAAWDFAIFASLQTGATADVTLVAAVALLGTVVIGVRGARGLARLEAAAVHD